MSTDLWTWRDGPLEPGRAVLVDIDGVLADSRHRQRFLDRRPRDWDRFFAAAAHDPPLTGGLRLLEAFEADLAVILVTGRPARLRSLTVTWLAEQGATWDLLAMRPDDDRAPASRFKSRAVAALGALGWQPILAIDDDPDVIASYQAAGIPGFRAAFPLP